MSQTLPVGRSAYLTGLTQQIERKLQRCETAILFDQNEDMINPAEVGMKSSPCFYEVLAEHFIQMPENGRLVLRLIVQLWSQSFASQIFSLLFYKWLFELPPEKSEGLLRYASAFVQGATNVFWIDVQSNTRRFDSLFHYTFEEVALVTIRLNKIPVQARRDLFFLLSRFLFFYEPADRLKTFLDHFPSLPNAFSVSSPADIFVIELTDQLQKLKVEPVLLNYLKSMRVLQGMELRMTTSIRLRSCLYSFTSPGGPMYPTRTVRHATFETLDLLFPAGRYSRHLISLFFRLLHPYYWPSSCWYFIITCIKVMLYTFWTTIFKICERVLGRQKDLENE